jgi:hypothetical protein
MRANLSYRDLKQLIQQARPFPRQGRQTHGDEDIALAFLWARLNVQPTYWAADRSAYPPAAAFDPPSASTLSRRLRRVPVIELLDRVQLRLAEQIPATPMKLMDCRPLTVGNASGDRDATRGYGAGARCRGYKFCALSSNHVVRQWTITSMNENDQKPGLKLLSELPEDSWGYVVADNGFDGNPLHAQAGRNNHVLVVPPRAANRGVRDAKRNTTERIRGLDLSDSPLRHAGVKRTFGSKLMHDRGEVERMLGHGTFLGLGPLPPWVRGPRRVASHVQAMLIFATHRRIEVHSENEAERQRVDSTPTQASEVTTLALYYG